MIHVDARIAARSLGKLVRIGHAVVHLDDAVARSSIALSNAAWYGGEVSISSSE